MHISLKQPTVILALIQTFALNFRILPFVIFRWFCFPFSTSWDTTSSFVVLTLGVLRQGGQITGAKDWRFWGTGNRAIGVLKQCTRRHFHAPLQWHHRVSHQEWEDTWGQVWIKRCWPWRSRRVNSFDPKHPFLRVIFVCESKVWRLPHWVRHRAQSWAFQDPSKSAFPGCHCSSAANKKMRKQRKPWTPLFPFPVWSTFWDPSLFCV